MIARRSCEATGLWGLELHEVLPASAPPPAAFVLVVVLTVGCKADWASVAQGFPSASW